MNVSVEPEYTKSETVVSIDESETTEPKTLTIETSALVPFLANQEEQNIVVSFTPVESANKEVSPVARLVDWCVTEPATESSDAVICCKIELESEPLFELGQLPVLEVKVSTKDGLQKHLHSTVLKLGKLIIFYYALLTLKNRNDIL